MDHITPPGCNWPEGFDVLSWLRNTFSGFPRVLELGCGRGRLASAFRDDQYLGVDVSEGSLGLAHQSNPTKPFLLLSEKAPVLPKADAALVYTVLLHVPDEQIDSVVKRLVDCAPVTYLVEILGRRWRREGDPPVFNREAEEYVELFDRHGSSARVMGTKPCVRYRNTVFTVIRAERRDTHAF
jgi:SAM-dependent methyltransferase